MTVLNEPSLPLFSPPFQSRQMSHPSNARGNAGLNHLPSHHRQGNRTPQPIFGAAAIKLYYTTLAQPGSIGTLPGGKLDIMYDLVLDRFNVAAAALYQEACTKAAAAAGPGHCRPNLSAVPSPTLLG